MHVDRMLRQMSAKQFAEWEAYYSLEPFGDEREDWRNAGIREMIFNMQMTKREHRRPMKDFLLLFGEPTSGPNKQTWQDKKAIAMMLVEAFKDAKVKD